MSGETPVRVPLYEMISEFGPMPEHFVRSVNAALARHLTRLHAAGCIHGTVTPVLIELTFVGPRLVRTIGTNSGKLTAGGQLAVNTYPGQRMLCSPSPLR
ncbi:hypothetical protein ACIBG0_41330 [Nocardia sp. NPDC050630]|uniref:hypothetical protein n=1 Tax=Nocardia sp. NPDC050630 TaxID=3364321 RepID=UPI0037A65724